MSEYAKPVKTTALLFAGVLAALCWTIGDMLLVGFVPQPERHPQLAVLAGRMEGDVQMAALMLDAAPACLLWGVLPATFSAPFYLAAAFGVYRLLRPGRTAVLCFALLFCASRCCFVLRAAVFQLCARAAGARRFLLSGQRRADTACRPYRRFNAGAGAIQRPLPAACPALGGIGRLSGVGLAGISVAGCPRPQLSAALFVLADAAAGRHCCCHGLQRLSPLRSGGAAWRCYV